MQHINNIIIVESPNDRAFVQVLGQEVELSATGIEIVDLHKFPDPTVPEKELRGKHAIGKKLEGLKGQLDRKYTHVKKIGVVLDMDDWDLLTNLKHVNKAVAFAFGTDPKFEKEGQFREISINAGRNTPISLLISCFFTKGYIDLPNDDLKEDAGNLDTLLFAIRKNPQIHVPYADCLHLWADCVNFSESNLKVSPNLYTKMWLDNFLRAMAKEKLGKSGKNILSDFEAKKSDVILELGKVVFDLKHTALEKFRQFLQTFK
ncbi:MAG: hypothetical protein IT260_06625 [Saprospiraceae bacterium]|nr:hypothetical protein [Saprospiraceae bacterium]